MNEQASKMEPWVLVLILVCVLAFFGGLWALGSGIASTVEEATMPIQAQAEANATAIKANTDYLQRMASNIDKLVASDTASAPAAEEEAKPEEEAKEGEGEASE